MIPDVDEWDATETMMEITLTKFIWVSMIIDRDFGFEETCVFLWKMHKMDCLGKKLYYYYYYYYDKNPQTGWLEGLIDCWMERINAFSLEGKK